MTGQRILIALLVVNLFATLLVYRGMELLVERVDRLQCESDSAADAGLSEKRSVNPAPGITNMDLAPAASATAPALADTASPVQDDQPIYSQEQADVVTADTDDIDLIKTRFAAQYGDSARTAQVQQALQSVANTATEYLGITQGLVECKESICKLTLGYADQSVFDAFVDDLTMALKGELSATLYFDEPLTVGGNSTVDVYLVRE